MQEVRKVRELARETHDIEEAAKRLGIGRTTAYLAARNGTFPVPVIRIGRRLVVSRAAIDRLLAHDPVKAPTRAEGIDSPSE